MAIPIPSTDLPPIFVRSKTLPLRLTQVEKFDQQASRDALAQAFRVVSRLPFSPVIRNRIRAILNAAPRSRLFVTDSQTEAVRRTIIAALDVNTRGFLASIGKLEHAKCLPRGTLERLRLPYSQSNPYLLELTRLARELGLWEVDRSVLRPREGRPTFLPWAVLADVLRDEIRHVSPRLIWPHVMAILQPMIKTAKLPGGKKSTLYSDPTSFLKFVRRQAFVQGSRWPEIKTTFLRQASR